jgi:NADP-dependent 3-hydroxy acid dehydrogenase YdfG
LIKAIRQEIKIFSRALDVSNDSAVSAFVADAAAWAGGKIDVLCCIAGVSPPQQSVVESDPLRWWKGLEVNINGVYLFARYVMPMMRERKQGHIIFASSAIVLGKHQNASSYSVGKMAVAHLAELIHEEMHGEGIRVFAFHPGGILTRLLTDMEDNEKAEWAVKASQVIRAMLNDDITLPGNSCVFLSTGKLDFMSGRYVDFTIGMDQLLQNQGAIEQHNLFKINVGANWDSAGGVRPFY